MERSLYYNSVGWRSWMNNWLKLKYYTFTLVNRGAWSVFVEQTISITIIAPSTSPCALFAINTNNIQSWTNKKCTTFEIDHYLSITVTFNNKYLFSARWRNRGRNFSKSHRHRTINLAHCNDVMVHRMTSATLFSSLCTCYGDHHHWRPRNRIPIPCQSQGTFWWTPLLQFRHRYKIA